MCPVCSSSPTPFLAHVTLSFARAVPDPRSSLHAHTHAPAQAAQGALRAHNAGQPAQAQVGVRTVCERACMHAYVRTTAKA